MGAGGGGAGIEIGKTAADAEDVMMDGVWNCDEGRTNIDFVPSTNPFPRRGSLGGLDRAGICVCRCGDVGWGEVIDRTISGPGCCRGGGPGLGPRDAPGIREAEKLGVISDDELEVFFTGGGIGLGSSNGRITVGLGTPFA